MNKLEKTRVIAVTSVFLALTTLSTTLAAYTAPDLRNVDVMFGEHTIVSERVALENNVATIFQGGKYVISGSTENGQLVVDSGDEEVILVLNGTNITNLAGGAAIYVETSGDVEIFLAEDSVNYLSDSPNYRPVEGAEKQSAPLYSRSDLKIDGAGNAILNISGNYRDGIVSKDDLDIKNVSINIEAVDDGIRGKDSVDIKNSNINIVSKGDAIKSDNDTQEGRGIIVLKNSDISISAGDDAIRAVNSVEIISGNIDITRSYEGIEAKKITIHNGTISIVSSDDALNIAATSADDNSGMLDGFRGRGHSVLEGGELNIHGGFIRIDSTGDGFDSNGSGMMTGGTLIVNGPTAGGDSPIDVDGSFIVSGGTIIAVGPSRMAGAPDTSSTQLSLQVNFSSPQKAGSELLLQDASGVEILRFSPIKTYESLTYSSAGLVQGKTYTLSVDGEKYVELTLNDMLTKHGESGRGGGQRWR